MDNTILDLVAMAQCADGQLQLTMNKIYTNLEPMGDEMNTLIADWLQRYLTDVQAMKEALAAFLGLDVTTTATDKFPSYAITGSANPATLNTWQTIITAASLAGKTRIKGVSIHYSPIPLMGSQTENMPWARVMIHPSSATPSGTNYFDYTIPYLERSPLPGKVHASGAMPIELENDLNMMEPTLDAHRLNANFTCDHQLHPNGEAVSVYLYGAGALSVSLAVVPSL